MGYLAKHIPVATLLVLSSVGVIVGDFFAKAWSVNQRTTFVVIAFLGYTASSILYLPTLLHEGLVITSTIWGLLSTIGFLVIGLVVYGENITGMQAIATGLGVVSLILFAFAGR